MTVNIFHNLTLFFKHVGDLGNINAKENGRAVFRFQNDALKVWDIIGRSLGVTEYRDDYGTGLNDISKINGNSGQWFAICKLNQ